jgi:hypothetical protein
MLNPASDSVLTRQVVSDLSHLYTYYPDPIPGNPLHWGGQFAPNSGGLRVPESQPTIVELQSDNDKYTTSLFPIGNYAAAIVDGHWHWDQVAIPQSQKTISEQEFYLRTPGNNPYLVNYIIDHPHQKPSLPEELKYNSKHDAFEYNLDNNPVDGIFTRALHGSQRVSLTMYSPFVICSAFGLRRGSETSPTRGSMFSRKAQRILRLLDLLAAR